LERLATMQKSPATFRYQSKEDDPYSSHSVILSRIGDGAGKRILDVGAAQGALAARFRERGFRVTCIEGDPGWAEAGKNKCDEMIIADLNQPLPQLTGKFEFIVYGDVLEHLKNPLAVFRALNQYLSPGGMIFVSVPNIAHLYVRLKLLAGRFDYMERGILDRTHLHFFTLASFHDFLRGAGVPPLEIIGTPVPLYLVWPASRDAAWLRALHGLNAALARGWRAMFGYQLVAVCRRESAA
jgi:SAM-dependent methyltransferase